MNKTNKTHKQYTYKCPLGQIRREPALRSDLADLSPSSYSVQRVYMAELAFLVDFLFTLVSFCSRMSCACGSDMEYWWYRVCVSVLGPERAGTEMGGDHLARY